MINTKVICLYGGPGVGKSTIAAEIYYRLKKDKQSVELSREYVKEWVWQDKKVGPFDQYYILGKQLKKETMVYGKVEYIVCDSPLLLCAFYDAYYNGSSTAKIVTEDIYRKAEEMGISFHHFLLDRNVPYETAGRYQKWEEAKEIDIKLEKFLNDNTRYTKLDNIETATDTILKLVT